MSTDLKTVILTGASRGIGHATVRRFNAEGWRVISCSREDIPQECRRDPDIVHHIVTDLADKDSLSSFVEQAQAILADAPLDALVNNAAISPKTATKGRLGVLDGDVAPGARLCRLPGSGQGQHRQHHLDRRPRNPSLRGFCLFGLQGSTLGLDPGDGGRVRG